MQQITYILDFDSTLVQCEALDELARLCLQHHPDQRDLMSQLEQLTHRGMTGELAFDASLTARLKLFAASKNDIAQLSDYLSTKISPSALKGRAWFKGQQDHIYVVSGGFEEYIIPIASRLHILPQHVFANRFLYQGEQISGFDAARPTSQQGGKVKQIASLHLPRPIIVIGDGFTDFETKQKGVADEFWAYTETVNRPKITTKADRVVSSFADIMSLSAVTV